MERGGAGGVWPREMSEGESELSEIEVLRGRWLVGWGEEEEKVRNK